MATPAPKPPRNQARTAEAMRKGQLRVNPSAVKKYNQTAKNALKAGKLDSAAKVTSSGFKTGNKSVSPTKPSVAKAALKGAANKVKAQGAKMNSSATSRLSQGRRGK